MKIAAMVLQTHGPKNVIVDTSHSLSSVNALYFEVTFTVFLHRTPFNPPLSWQDNTAAAYTMVYVSISWRPVAG